MHKWFKYSKLRVFFIFVFGFNALEYFYSDVALFEVSEPRYVFNIGMFSYHMSFVLKLNRSLG